MGDFPDAPDWEELFGDDWLPDAPENAFPAAAAASMEEDEVPDGQREEEDESDAWARQSLMNRARSPRPAPRPPSPRSGSPVLVSGEQIRTHTENRMHRFLHSLEYGPPPPARPAAAVEPPVEYASDEEGPEVPDAQPQEEDDAAVHFEVGYAEPAAEPMETQNPEEEKEEEEREDAGFGVPTRPGFGRDDRRDDDRDRGGGGTGASMAIYPNQQADPLYGF